MRSQEFWRPQEPTKSDELKKLFISKWKILLKIAMICVILGVAFIVKIKNEDADVVKLNAETSGDDSTSQLEVDSTDVPIYVDISGAVKNPGVYELDDQTRLFELIEKAGGLNEDADIDSINQAAYVADGDKVIVPSRADNGIGGDVTSNTVAQNKESVVNINTADKETLMKLPGVGDAIADRIIEHRRTQAFKKKEDIKNVSGIGDATYEKMKDKISI